MKWSAFLKNKVAPVTGLLIVLFIMLVILDEVEQSQKKQLQQTLQPSTSLPVVSVATVEPERVRLDVKVLSRVRPRYQSMIRSHVEGSVVSFSERLVEGAVIEEGELLLQLDDSQYAAELAQARMDKAQAEVAVLTEQQMAQQAQRDWQRSDRGQPDSPLVLRIPQYEAAELTQQAALANLHRAQTLLSYTRVRAPYRAVVLKRHVNPGELVGVGQVLLDIMSVDEYELVVSLNDKQWQLMAEDWRHQQATLIDPISAQTWQAEIRNAGYYYDSETQLRNLYLSVTAQADGLLPGRLLEVSLPGKLTHDALLIPESAYSRDAHIWLLREDDRLEKFAPDILAVQDGSLVIRPPKKNSDPLRIALFPQAQFTVGLKVAPIDPIALPGSADQVVAKKDELK
ncbi:efflux RND transporter periplasmic adaptor subunit [Nitrincola sp. MINF-07-Sa-05]|uniref:efflux RND transporter periplasmic adaptor subunit n=1 Tax=Nitrincola salilacus TaxID=3400273 RepID=UPI00391831D6